jgi:hypothetical protein
MKFRWRDLSSSLIVDWSLGVEDEGGVEVGEDIAFEALGCECGNFLWDTGVDYESCHIEFG